MHKRKILFDVKKSWEVGILLGGIENDFLAFFKKKWERKFSMMFDINCTSFKGG